MLYRGIAVETMTAEELENAIIESKPTACAECPFVGVCHNNKLFNNCNGWEASQYDEF